ncbi:MAG: hypothetical protein M2R45_03153 [Verrucomicrobia subdivision 3 bacterium]|nr:hypothetical protein [Limisphaerales bacterium]MCS1413221.1 hypothetical protein [Limisphaerales bacterium]
MQPNGDYHVRGQRHSILARSIFTLILGLKSEWDGLVRRLRDGEQRHGLTVRDITGREFPMGLSFVLVEFKSEERVVVMARSDGAEGVTGPTDSNQKDKVLGMLAGGVAHGFQ